jgi:hypothetical protein
MRILKIESLPPTKEAWCDRDEIMLHACFQLLIDAVEKEKVDTHCNYKSHKEFVDEVRFLYAWWKKRIEKEMSHELESEDDDYNASDTATSSKLTTTEVRAAQFSIMNDANIADRDELHNVPQDTPSATATEPAHDDGDNGSLPPLESLFDDEFRSVFANPNNDGGAAALLSGANNNDGNEEGHFCPPAPPPPSASAFS